MRKATLLLMAAIIICPILTACTNVTKPTVGHIPDGWYLMDQTSYGTIEDDDGTQWGGIAYGSEIGTAQVLIFYGDVPRELIGNETNEDTLIELAILWGSEFVPTETGTMTIGNCPAGYARAYDASYDCYDMEIVFVIDSTCIDIYAIFDATATDEAQAMSLINSIH